MTDPDPSYAGAASNAASDFFIECRAQRLGLERHGLVAIANKSGCGVFGRWGFFAPATY